MEELIEEAAQFLKGKVLTTPVEYSPELSKILKQPTYLKLECLQTTGSFKVRGGFFFLSQSKEKNGVAACSAGNHGLGVAYAAKQMGIPCTVFVTKSVDESKVDKMLILGATVRKSDFIGYDDTFVWAEKEAAKEKLIMVPAYNDERIMAANGGTLAVEVLDQAPECTHFILPMGGGGLSGGFSWYMKAKNPVAKITVCQLKESPAFKLSLEQNKAVTYMPPIDTLAGGLEGGLGVKCFEILKNRVDSIALLSDGELKEAIVWLLKHHQYLVEPSGAAALAACLFGHVKPKEPTVIVLSGRNVSLATLQDILCSPKS